MTTSLDRFLDFWPSESTSRPGRSSLPGADPSRQDPEVRVKSGPPITPAMRRAEETTRIAREATDAATERRLAQVAKLRAARLEKEATEAATAPPKAPAKAAPKARRKAG